MPNRPAAEQLKSCFLCRGLDQNEMAALFDISTVRTLEKGETLFLEGDIATGFYVLLDGRIRIYKVSAEGKEFTLHSIAPGQMFAEVAIFHGRTFPANATATENSSVVFFPKEPFLALIQRSPQMSLKMIAALSMFIREYNQKVEELSLKEVPARLASYLLGEAARTGKQAFDLQVSKAELASTIGTIAETLSRTFKKFSAQEILEVHGEHIVILDLSELEAIADGKKL